MAKKLLKTKKILGAAIILAAVFFAGSAHAASLYFKPAAGSYPTGSTFTVDIYVSPEGQPINAVSGSATFSTGKLSVVSLNKSGSILNMWVREPSFSNSTGAIDFEGVALNPGFSGTAGKVLSVTFKAGTAGSAALAFSSGEVLAADGAGTSLPLTLGNGSLTVTARVAEPEPVVAPTPVTTTPVKVTSAGLTIKEVEKTDLTEPQSKFIFSIDSKKFGLDHYEISLDGGESENWLDDSSHTYVTSVLKYGQHNISVRAINKDGVSLVAEKKFSIEPLTAPMINPISSPSDGNNKMITGKTDYPGAKIVLTFRPDDGSNPFDETTQSDQSGNFSWSAASLSRGNYHFTAQAIDKRGAYSLPSAELSITIIRQSFLETIGHAISFPVVSITLNLILIILAAWGWYKWRKTSQPANKNLKSEVKEAEIVLKRAFALLRQDVKDQVRILEKTRARRTLTREEESVSDQLRKDLADAEKFIGEEIRDIEGKI